MKAKIILAAVLSLSVLSLFAAPPAEEGKTIFTSRCAACHNVNKIVVGPALAGVDERRSIDWIINFVHSSQKLVKSGDADAVALYNQFNKIQMPDHPDLTADNIRSIVEYIKTEAKIPQPKAVIDANQVKPNLIFMILHNNALLAIFSTLLFLLATAITLLVSVKQLRRSKNI